MSELEDFLSRHIEKYSDRPSSKGLRPKFVYHYTNITNAVKVLSAGSLYSRAEASARGLMENDNAASCVISATSQVYKEYARLYFGPKTPTQYHNEGIRPVEQRYEGAHCPVPVFFAFDKIAVLTRPDVRVSDGSVASHLTTVGPADIIFKSIPFDKVFHRGPVDPSISREITNHRHAEVLIPNSLPLDNNLVWIGCRSNAERQSLLFLLDSSVQKKYMPLIRLCDSAFFEKRWIFIERVEFSERLITFHFNPNSSYREQATVRLDVQYPNGGIGSKTFQVDLSRAKWQVRLPADYDWLIVKLYIFECLAYASKLSSEELL